MPYLCHGETSFTIAFSLDLGILRDRFPVEAQNEALVSPDVPQHGQRASILSEEEIVPMDLLHETGRRSRVSVVIIDALRGAPSRGATVQAGTTRLTTKSKSGSRVGNEGALPKLPTNDFDCDYDVRVESEPGFNRNS